MLSSPYVHDAITERKSREWFHGFKNGDFNVKDLLSCGREEDFEDSELEELIKEDSSSSKKG